MTDYEKYVSQVNNIFSLLEKCKNGWTNNDNLSYIEQINEFKNIVINGANYLGDVSSDDKKEEVK